MKEYKKEIKKLGYNTTYHRDLVVKVLFLSSDYDDAMQICSKIKEVFHVQMKLSMVKKILLFLQKAGMLSVADVGSSKKYRLLHHAKGGCFVCKKCARVEEFEDAKLVALVHQAAQKYGFEVDRNRAFVLSVR